MANVYLTSVHPRDNEHRRYELNCLLSSAHQDRFDVHELTHDPKSADLIIFVERENGAGHHLEKIRKHPFYRRYRDKCFHFNPRFKGVPSVRGVYASIPQKWYDRSRYRASHYPEVREDRFFSDQGSIPASSYLYSFRGNAQASPVRRALTKMKHTRGYFEDTSDTGLGGQKFQEEQGGNKDTFVRQYVELAKHSKFVLCPRGTGPSSLRLYETMLMGRPPVIISDAWTPPEGPNWDKCSIQVPESQICRIPSLLEKHEHEASEMGREARSVWENWFSPESSFHRMVEWCLDIAHTEPSINDYYARLRLQDTLLPIFKMLDSAKSKTKYNLIRYTLNQG